VSLDSWTHLFIVDILFGVFARGVITEEKVTDDWRTKLRILLRAVWEQRQVLDASPVVEIGQNCSIDPSAVIHGMTTIGNNVNIGPGVVIDNCIIGDNVNVSQGCQLMLSVVGDGSFLPFRASLFMTTMMERSMVAQNTCLQMCVVGRDSFIGAGTTFTDFNVVPAPLRATGPDGLQETGMIVLGGCVGHHCRLSSGLIMMPARTIESDVVLLAKDDQSFIHHDVRYEDSDHHDFDDRYPYPRLYPRQEQRQTLPVAAD
jgi:carbonic anhydrase/acetyltransferase-like protein (isoleucine patch superfamily)